jgi:peptide deformylase
VDVEAKDKNFNPLKFRAGGLLARAIQHEKDHLDGILFIDRMTKKAREENREETDALQTATRAELKKK